MEEAEKKSYAAAMAETPTDQSAPRTPVTFKITFLLADNSLQRALRQEVLCWQDTNPDVTLELRKVLGVAGQPEQAVLCAKRKSLLSQDVQDALTELAGGKLPMGTNLEMAKNAIDATGRLKPGVGTARLFCARLRYPQGRQNVKQLIGQMCPVS